MTGHEGDPLVLELLEWVSAAERTYPEAMEAWASRCPRHTPWEDALAAGLIRVESRGAADRAVVVLTDRGAAALQPSVFNRPPSDSAARGGPATP